MYQNPHAVKVDPYPLGGDVNPFIFGATCACGWLWMPNAYERTVAAIREHYVAEAMAVPRDPS